MKLRDTDFGPILGASGVQGFFGEGYPFHRLLGPLGPNFDGMTFVAKTTTLNKREGNMPLRADLTPRELKPRCIWVSPRRGIALNAVGLSGPGASAFLDPYKMPPRPKTRGYPGGYGLWPWTRRLSAFMISFMPDGKTAEERIDEMKRFTDLLGKWLPSFKAKVGLQINVSCPNTGLDPTKLVGEVVGLLDIASALGIPLMPKFNLLAPPETVVEMSKHDAYDATCISNTLPFGALADRVPWERYFPHGSPLAKFGGGGLSGEVLRPLVGEWIERAYAAGMQKPMNVGGGIMKPSHIDFYVSRGLRPGVDSVFIGSVAMLRPWRVAGIIRYAKEVLAEEREEIPLAA